ncbi:MAG: choice-of-anchor D domain-containing protein [Rhodocyclaceae bacterium]|nr:choice-of-anchor D domain-containing protein [Rhodocyclaceae bacterium]
MLSTNVTGGASGQIVAGAGSQVLQNGVTISGTVNTSGGGLFSVVSSFANRLDGVTFNGNMDMASIANSRQRVTPGGLVLNGTVNINSNGILSFEDNGTFSGNGTVVFGNTGAGNRIDLDGNGTTTIASGVTIRGHSGTIGQHVNIGGTQTLVNNGLISADVSGGTIGFVDSAVVNNSTLKATNGGLLNLGTAVSQGASGVILADNGTVRQNGARISGGTIASANGGALQVASSSANYLDAATISGVVDMASVATSRQRVNNGLTNNGTININQNAILSFEDTQTLSGTGSIVFGNTGGGNRIDLDGNGTTTIASGVTIRGHSGAIGQQINIGGTQTLLNQGTINAELAGGTIGFADSALVNNGVLRAQAGTMYVGVPLSGTGTLQVDSTGTMNLANGAKGQGTLAMGGAGAALNLGTGNLTLSNDYTNAGAGTGNAFNRRAGVSGTGQIVAGGDVSQVITGANVTNGNTANATLTVGNVRVGSNTFNYQIGNAGTTGPTLRGAIQTAANGGNINDARLSGTGVTASNYNAGGPGGNSGNLAVVFNAASAGALAPLSGQAVNLRSNFENIADQKLNIVLAGGAAAYNAAVGAATPTPVVIANQRVGGTGSQMLTVSNTAAAGAYSEDLNASVTGFTGAAGFTGGNINGLLAGANNSSTMGVRVDTTLAGAKTGTVTLGYQTAGAVNGASNGLGVASAGSQTVTVSGNVYQVAAGALQGNTLNFGTLQVGQQVSQNLVVRNTATGPAGFVEDLNASFGASGNSQITGTGSLNGILAGTNSTGANGTMTVTVLGSTAGALNSGIAVNYFSAGAVNGVGNGLGVLGVGSEQFNVNGTISAVGNVINQASPLVNTPTVTLAARRVGDAAATANVSVSNVATVAPQAALNASIATNGAPVTASGSFNLLTPGATDNSSLVVGIGTATAGNFTGGNAGSATISLVSDASNVGGCAPNCQLNLAPQTVTVEGKVYTAAQGAVQGTVNFGIVHVGDVVAAQGVAVQNSAPATALNDTLKASIGGTGGAFTDNGGTVTGLVAGGAANTSALAVGLDTTTAGIYSGNAIVSLASQNPDMADLDLGTANVSLSGQVNKYANAVFDKVSGAGTLSRSGNVFTLDFGNVLLGGALSAILDVDNAVGGGPSDLLDGVLGMNDVNDFTTLLLSSFQNIGADGSGGNALSFLFDTNSLGLGTFQDSIDLGWFGHNASGYVDPTRHYTLLVRGNVYTNGGTVPEPSAALLVLTALAGLALRRRRSGRAC